MDIEFISRLKNFNKNEIDDNVLKKLRLIVLKPEFDPELIGAKIYACKSLAQWAKAMENYAKINKEVLPKREKVQQMQSILDVKNAELAKKQEQFDEVKSKVDKLQQELNQTMEDQINITNEIKLANQRLINAELLIGLLQQEGENWKVMVQQINQEIEQLIGNVFICAVNIGYSGLFDSKARQIINRSLYQILEDNQIKFEKDLDFSKYVVDAIEIRNWLMN